MKVEKEEEEEEDCEPEVFDWLRNVVPPPLDVPEATGILASGRI